MTLTLPADEDAVLRAIAGDLGQDISGTVERLLTAAAAGGWLDVEERAPERVSPHISREMLTHLERLRGRAASPASLGAIVSRVVRMALAARLLGHDVLAGAPLALPEILEMRRLRASRRRK